MLAMYEYHRNLHYLWDLHNFCKFHNLEIYAINTIYENVVNMCECSEFIKKITKIHETDLIFEMYVNLNYFMQYTLLNI